MRSVMMHNFSMVPRADIPRSQFKRSCGRKTTFDAGFIVPVFIDEVLPGDTMNMRMASFCRLATPLVPFMDNMFLDTFWFFVPYRLIWDNWQKFNGEQVNPGDSTDYLIPQIEDNPLDGKWDIGSLADYFGLPVNDTANGLEGSFCTFPFRAYNLIYNEWFRDQNLQDSVVVDKDDGPDDAGDYNLLLRGKRHDYFTSCLPWPQKSDAVEIPLGANVARDSNAPVWKAYLAGSNTLFGANDLVIDAAGGLDANGAGDVSLDPNGGLSVEFTANGQGTINALRQAVQLQRLYERDARGGTRYTEIIRAHFGVISPDARLQRPEYLGGNSTPLQLNPIAQTSSTDATTPQGNLAAMGTISQNGSGFVKSFTEHGLIMGLVNVRADLSYWQGVDRMWSRRTRWDFYWPALSHIGEQAVLNKEIYYQNNPTADDAVFGYQERFAEYRYKRSEITGMFRGSATAPLDQWHLAQEFSALPSLNAGFIVESPPVDRVIATPSEPHFLADFYFDYKCARPMPMYAVPGMMDHF